MEVHQFEPNEKIVALVNPIQEQNSAILKQNDFILHVLASPIAFIVSEENADRDGMT